MCQLGPIWCNKHLKLSSKICIYNTYITPVLLYGSETWTLFKGDDWKIKAFHMMCKRCILGVKWQILWWLNQSYTVPAWKTSATPSPVVDMPCLGTSVSYPSTPAHVSHIVAHLPLLISILAFCGDIHTNTGPPAPSFSFCTYNIHSLLVNDHISALNDLIETHHPNIIALMETWINKSSTPSESAGATPSGYTLISYPRTTKKSHLWQNLGWWNCLPHHWLNFYNT